MKSTITALLFLLPLVSISQEITSVSPSSANAGETLDVTITGLNTNFTQGSSTSLYISSYFGQGSGSILQNSYTVINDNSIVFNLTVQNNAIPGNYDFSMYNSNWQQFGLEDAFYVGPLVGVEINKPGNYSPNLISIFPNPGNGIYTLDMKELNQPRSLKIYDIQGNLIFHKDINMPASIVDIRNVSSGIYLVKIEGEKPIRIVKE